MRAVYISANNDQARANTLGLGLIITPGTVTPFALLQGAGLVFVLPEPINVATLQANEQTILTTEAATDAATATANANLAALLTKAANAIAANQTFQAIPSPTQAQGLAQIQALTLQVNALIRVVANQLSSQSGT